MSLSNQNAIITGASGALGQHVVKEFLQQGANVFAVARSADKLDALQQHVGFLPGRLTPISADLTDFADVERAWAEIQGKAKPVDMLINIAGGFAGGKMIADTSVQEWDRMMNLNLRSVFVISKLVMAEMMRQQKGKIITVSALAALDPKPKRAAYLVAKAGLIALTQALAAEGKEYNIQANTIAPAIILTDANVQAMPEMDSTRWTTPQQIAATMLFLCSPEADAITGSIIKMPGRL